MRKMRDLIGLPVLETVTGQPIGEVRDTILWLEEATLYAVIVADSSWFGQDRGILFQDIFAIGLDAVMVTSADVVRDMTDTLSEKSSQRFSGICNKQVYTEMGDYLGVIADLSYDSVSGEILSYQLSDSFVADFLYGRLEMPLPKAQVLEEKKMIVPEAMSKLLHQAN